MDKQFVYGSVFITNSLICRRYPPNSIMTYSELSRKDVNLAFGHVTW